MRRGVLQGIGIGIGLFIAALTIFSICGIIIKTTEEKEDTFLGLPREDWKELGEEIEKSQRQILEAFETPKEEEPLIFIFYDEGPALTYAYEVKSEAKKILKIINKGSDAHVFEIPRLKVFQKIQPGETVKMEITMPKKIGRYDIFWSGIKIGQLIVSSH